MKTQIYDAFIIIPLLLLWSIFIKKIITMLQIHIFLIQLLILCLLQPNVTTFYGASEQERNVPNSMGTVLRIWELDVNFCPIKLGTWGFFSKHFLHKELSCIPYLVGNSHTLLIQQETSKHSQAHGPKICHIFPSIRVPITLISPAKTS